MSSKKIRTFICIDFPDEVIKEVARIQQLISKRNFHGKLTELENLHLTLKFLGEIDEKLLEKIKKKLFDINLENLNLYLERVGTFNYKRDPRIVWIKISGKDIFNLQKQIDGSLGGIFPKEKRFMSHLTIARIKFVKNRENFKEYASKIKCKKISFKINSFELKSSELKSFGPVYQTLKKYKLGSS